MASTQLVEANPVMFNGERGDSAPKRGRLTLFTLSR